MKKRPDIEFLTIIASKAGVIMKEKFKLGMDRVLKKDRTPLTLADTTINKMAIEMLQKEYSGLSIVGEEGSAIVRGAEYRILFDPVDGTIPFCRGIPVSTFCIAAFDDDGPFQAVIHDPFMDRTWSAERGQGAWMSKVFKPLRTSKQTAIADANVSMIWWKDSPYHLNEVCGELMKKGMTFINLVSVGYMGGLMACGEIDGSIFPGKKGWETGAMQLMVEESGGKTSDMFGNPLTYEGDEGHIKGHIMAATPELHASLVKVVARCQRKRAAKK
ncbi:MAG: hisN [Candidatus Taylorbacteria bacterium]|nr:hisN [Candidatus Taylorbacteria bacterium]